MGSSGASVIQDGTTGSGPCGRYLQRRDGPRFVAGPALWGIFLIIASTKRASGDLHYQDGPRNSRHRYMYTRSSRSRDRSVISRANSSLVRINYVRNISFFYFYPRIKPKLDLIAAHTNKPARKPSPLSQAIAPTYIMSMLAVVFEGPGKVSVQDRPIPKSTLEIPTPSQQLALPTLSPTNLTPSP